MRAAGHPAALLDDGNSNFDCKTGVHMFIPIVANDTTLTIYFNGTRLPARSGETVASCLLRAGVERFRTTPVSGAPRLPYCMIGHCFECLVHIDGLGSRQACLCQVSDGMKISTLNGSIQAIEVFQS